MERTLKTTPITIALHRDGESPVFGENTIRITMDDEGGGEFFVIKNLGDEKDGALRVDLNELERIVEVARTMINNDGE